MGWICILGFNNRYESSKFYRGSLHLRGLCLCFFCCIVAGCAPALFTRFEQTLSTQHSATVALEQWCAELGIAVPSQIVALPVRNEAQAEPAGLRKILAISEAEPVRFRFVKLNCGEKTLSEAMNWYVPARLTPEMNAMLENTTTPFGLVVAPIGFQRERLEARRGALPGCPKPTILTHRARLILPDGKPLALVTECYTAENLRRGDRN